MHSLHAFWHMGGYAFYVWTAYAVFFVVLAADYLAPVLRRRRTLRALRARIRRQQARDARKAHLNATPGQDDDRTSTPSSS